MHDEEQQPLPPAEAERQDLTKPLPQMKVPSMWKFSEQGRENVELARQNLNTRHGMFANIPIVCKGAKCPYFSTCWIPVQDLQLGERCPIEIAAILERFEAYCRELAIENPELEIVDAGLVKEVVDIEVMILRADGLLARSGEMIEETVAGISPKGQEYYKNEINPVVKLKDQLRERKVKILNQLNATRKDKKEEVIEKNDPSSVVARLIRKVQRAETNGVIDITPEETGETAQEKG